MGPHWALFPLKYNNNWFLTHVLHYNILDSNRFLFYRYSIKKKMSRNGTSTIEFRGLSKEIFLNSVKKQWPKTLIFRELLLLQYFLHLYLHYFLLFFKKYFGQSQVYFLWQTVLCCLSVSLDSVNMSVHIFLAKIHLWLLHRSVTRKDISFL